jgi:hypothetical protein
MKKKIVLIIAAGVILIIIITLLIFRNDLLYQCADLSEAEPIQNPAYPAMGPVILFDEGHGNFHTMAETYKPFVRLLTADGYRFRLLTEEIDASRLLAADVLVIANPADPLKQLEINALVDWVKGGKSLLLISDHPPFASPLQELCHRFEVKLSGMWTADPDQKEPNAPEGGFGAQAVAIEFGKGRILVVGEAGMLTTQVIRFLFFNLKKFGFNRPGNDNRQFVLNIMHWLTRLI